MATGPMVIKSKKGADIVYDIAGYEYRKYHVDAAGQQLYRCLKYRCKGKAKMVNGVATEYSQHIPLHLPPDHSEEIRTVRKHCKEQRQMGVTTQDIIRSNVLNAPPHLQPLLSANAVARTAQRSVQVSGMKNWPATIDPTKFAFRFVREDTCHLYPKGNPRAFKILCSDFGLQLLRSVVDWSIDGTFFASPHDFEQILIIGVQENHLLTPCLYAFITSKVTAAYESVFAWLNNQGVPAPLTVSCDFEIGMSKGFIRVFPTATVSRCAFHFYQAIFRKIQVLGLADIYRAPNTKKFLKGLMALSLLPHTDITRYFDKLKDEALHNLPRSRIARVEDLFNYFESTFIGVKARNGIRVNPLHPMQTWSVYTRILAQQQIGNSTIESFNSKLKKVPPGSSCQKVASILAEHDLDYKAKHESARLQQLTLAQAYPQPNQTVNRQARRMAAVSNGPMGQSEVDHLTALSTHIFTPN